MISATTEFVRCWRLAARIDTLAVVEAKLKRLDAPPVIVYRWQPRERPLLTVYERTATAEVAAVCSEAGMEAQP